MDPGECAVVEGCRWWLDMIVRVWADSGISRDRMVRRPMLIRIYARCLPCKHVNMSDLDVVEQEKINLWSYIAYNRPSKG